MFAALKSWLIQSLHGTLTTTVPHPLVPQPILGGLTSFHRLDFQGFGASVLAPIICSKLSLCWPLVREFEAAGG